MRLEVPGPWGHVRPGRQAHRSRALSRELARAAAASGAHVPADPPSQPHVPAPCPGTGGPADGTWAIAHASAGDGARAGGALWRDPRRARSALTLAAPAARVGRWHGTAAAGAGVQRTAKRDQCCALRGPTGRRERSPTGPTGIYVGVLAPGRPPFRGYMMLLPTGDMFGWLDEGSAVEVTRPLRRGRTGAAPHLPWPVRVSPSRCRPRMHAPALQLGDSRRGVLQGVPVRLGAEGRWGG